MDDWEQRMVALVRRGEGPRVQFLQHELKNRVLPGQLKRIQQNDKTVLKEIVLPDWLDWDLLYEWSLREPNPQSGVECILCNRKSKTGTDFEGKFICDECFFRIKSMP